MKKERRRKHRTKLVGFDNNSAPIQQSHAASVPQSFAAADTTSRLSSISSYGAQRIRQRKKTGFVGHREAAVDVTGSSDDVSMRQGQVRPSGIRPLQPSVQNGQDSEKMDVILVTVDAKDKHRIREIQNLSSDDEEDVAAKERKLQWKLGIIERRGRIEPPEHVLDTNRVQTAGRKARGPMEVSAAESIHTDNKSKRLKKRKRGEDVMRTEGMPSKRAEEERKKPKKEKRRKVEKEVEEDGPLFDDDGNELFVVEKLLHKKEFAGHRKAEYLIKWKGYPIDESTWEVRGFFLSLDAST